MELISPSEAAKRYGFSASQIRRLIRQGIIKAEKVGSYYVINTIHLNKLKRRRHFNTKED